MSQPAKQAASSCVRSDPARLPPAQGNVFEQTTVVALLGTDGNYYESFRAIREATGHMRWLKDWFGGEARTMRR